VIASVPSGLTTCLNFLPARSFYSTRLGSYNETRGLTSGSEVVGTLLQ
jgi:hypothetical protein